MTLENKGSISISRAELAIDAKEIDRDKLPFVYGKVHKGEFYFTSKSYGISHFDSKGTLINSTKIAAAIKPIIQDFIDDSNYLLYSFQGILTGIWGKHEINPKKYLRLNNEIFPFSTQFDRINRRVLLFTGSYYSFLHEHDNNHDSSTVMYLLDLSTDLESNGKIIKKIKAKREDIVLPLHGRRLNDGRTFVLSANSKLLEYNKEYEYVFSFEGIKSFQSQRTGEEYSDTLDSFQLNAPLPIYNKKYLLALRNFQGLKRTLDIWNIESRKYECGLDIGGKVLIDADDDYIYLLDDIDDETAKIGKYSISFKEDRDSYLSMLNLENPITKELYSLASVLPAFEKHLCVIFPPEIGDCGSLAYVFDMNGWYYICSDDFPKPFICYTEEDPVLGTSYLNSSSLGYDACLNSDPMKTADLPYAVIIDRHTKIIKTLTLAEFDESYQCVSKRPCAK